MKIMLIEASATDIWHFQRAIIGHWKPPADVIVKAFSDRFVNYQRPIFGRWSPIDDVSKKHQWPNKIDLWKFSTTGLTSFSDRWRHQQINNDEASSDCTFCVQLWSLKGISDRRLTFSDWYGRLLMPLFAIVKTYIILIFYQECSINKFEFIEVV